MKAMNLRNKLEEVIDILNSDYTPEQWKNKEKIDMARYEEAKKTYNEAETAIEYLDWDGSSDEDYEAITELMDKLSRKINMIEGF